MASIVLAQMGAGALGYNLKVAFVVAGMIMVALLIAQAGFGWKPPQVVWQVLGVIALVVLGIFAINFLLGMR